MLFWVIKLLKGGLKMRSLWIRLPVFVVNMTIIYGAWRILTAIFQRIPPHHWWSVPVVGVVGLLGFWITEKHARKPLVLTTGMNCFKKDLTNM